MMEPQYASRSEAVKELFYSFVFVTVLVGWIALFSWVAAQIFDFILDALAAEMKRRGV